MLVYLLKRPKSTCGCFYPSDTCHGVSFQPEDFAEQWQQLAGALPFSIVHQRGYVAVWGGRWLWLESHTELRSSGLPCQRNRSWFPKWRVRSDPYRLLYPAWRGSVSTSMWSWKKRHLELLPWSWLSLMIWWTSFKCSVSSYSVSHEIRMAEANELSK